MLTEEQKRKIENLYNDYYEMAYNTETREDMKFSPSKGEPPIKLDSKFKKNQFFYLIKFVN